MTAISVDGKGKLFDVNINLCQHQHVDGLWYHDQHVNINMATYQHQHVHVHIKVRVNYINVNYY